MPARRRYLAAAVTMASLALAGCGTSRAAESSSTTAVLPTTTAPSTAAPATTAAPTTTTVVTTTVPPTTAATPPVFNYSAFPVTAAELGRSWHAGCPVGPDQLRLVRMLYHGFDGHAHNGTMVVNASVVAQVAAVFKTLYEESFPLKEMIPVSAYGGSDNAAAAADDTSAFNCRYAVAPGPPQWSVHAFGEAIDVNDVQNPYVLGSEVIPPAGGAYLNRSDVRPGMAVPGGQLVEAFASVGWQWGGRWTSSPDYQHFSSTGG